MNWNLYLTSSNLLPLDTFNMKCSLLRVYFFYFTLYPFVFSSHYSNRVTFDYTYIFSSILFAKRVLHHSANHLIPSVFWKMYEFWINACHDFHLYYHPSQVGYPWPLFRSL